LCKVLERKPGDLDRDRDGLVTWKEVFPTLEKETSVSFAIWLKDSRSRQEAGKARPQKPHAHALGKAVAQAESAFAAVSIRNKTNETMNYLYRWSDESRWQKDTIPPGGEKVHHQRLSGLSGEAVSLKVQVLNSSLMADLKASHWRGVGEPSAKNGWP